MFRVCDVSTVSLFCVTCFVITCVVLFITYPFDPDNPDQAEVDQDLDYVEIQVEDYNPDSGIYPVTSQMPDFINSEFHATTIPSPGLYQQASAVVEVPEVREKKVLEHFPISHQPERVHYTTKPREYEGPKYSVKDENIEKTSQKEGTKLDNNENVSHKHKPGLPLKVGQPTVGLGDTQGAATNSKETAEDDRKSKEYPSVGVHNDDLVKSKSVNDENGDDDEHNNAHIYTKERLAEEATHTVAHFGQGGATMHPQRPAPEVYTSRQITKLAMEYFNSAKISKVPFPRPRSKDKRPKRGLDSTVKDDPAENVPKKSSMPKYATYKVSATSTLPPPCFRRPYVVQQVCELTTEQTQINGEGITLEDVARLLFNRSTLAALKDWCVAGEWCLERDRFELFDQSQSFLQLCDLESCLLQMPDYCINEERRLVMSTLFLLCRARALNVSDTCFKAIGQTAHVTMTDLYRSKFRKEEVICFSASDKEGCSGPCSQLAETLYCLQKSCDNLTVIFQEYSPWSWFFTLHQPQNICPTLNSSHCPLFADHTSVPDTSPLTAVWEFFVQSFDHRLLLGVILGAVLAMAVVATLSWALITWCTIRASYERDLVHYSPITPQDMWSEDEL